MEPPGGRKTAAGSTGGSQRLPFLCLGERNRRGDLNETISLVCLIMATPLDILITGGTGYIGRNLIPPLIARSHRVRVLARKESVARVPAGATAVIGDPLDDQSVARTLGTADTLIHLVG